ncbi:MAG: hypothetical protein HQ541_19180 [Mariniphaga sp.]|nr:hypothetical protein [Mariniphaga sp.]
MKLFHLSWSGYTLFFGSLFLSSFYYVFGFAIFNKIGFRGIIKKESYSDISARPIILAIAFGWALSATTVGWMFKLEQLPYAGYIIMFGLITALIILVFSFILDFSPNQFFFKIIASRLVIMGLLSLILFYLA